MVFWVHMLVLKFLMFVVCTLLCERKLMFVVCTMLCERKLTASSFTLMFELAMFLSIHCTLLWYLYFLRWWFDSLLNEIALWAMVLIFSWSYFTQQGLWFSCPDLAPICASNYRWPLKIYCELHNWWRLYPYTTLKFVLNSISRKRVPRHTHISFCRREVSSVTFLSIYEGKYEMEGAAFCFLTHVLGDS